VAVGLSKRVRSIGGILTSALRLLAVYAGVRAALRAGVAHGYRARSGALDHERRERLAKEVEPTRLKVPAGAARSSSLGSTADLSPSTKAGSASQRGVAERTYRELYEEARRQGVRGRSGMSKAALEAALSEL